MRDRLLLGVARPVRGSSVKILRQNRLLYRYAYSRPRSVDTGRAGSARIAVSDLPAARSGAARGLWARGAVLCAVHRLPCCAGRAIGAPYLICELGGGY